MTNEIKIEFGEGQKLSAITDDYCIDVDMPTSEGGQVPLRNPPTFSGLSGNMRRTLRPQVL